MNRTKIQWTDYSWPIVNGCRRVSPGCVNCYAERLIATRLSKTPKYQGLAMFTEKGPRWTGDRRLWLDDIDGPLRVRGGARIFVADMGDLFYEQVTNEEIATVFGIMAACPQHTFQVLTKRPERMVEWFRWIESFGHPNILGCLHINAGPYLDARAHDVEADLFPQAETLLEAEWPLPNVHLGVSVESQDFANDRIPMLLSTPAASRFVSYEPALGPVEFDPWLYAWRSSAGLVHTLNWIIIGGESGPGARPFDHEWAGRAITQCRVAGGTKVFVKQLGSVWAKAHGAKDGHGGDPAEWPEGLRVREFPETA